MLSFVGKHLRFYLNGVCSFFIFFYLNEKELKQQVCLKKCAKNGIANSAWQEKRDREELKHNPTLKTSILKLLKNCHYLH